MISNVLFLNLIIFAASQVYLYNDGIIIEFYHVYKSGDTLKARSVVVRTLARDTSALQKNRKIAKNALRAHVCTYS